jgi:hypothetical protein
MFNKWLMTSFLLELVGLEMIALGSKSSDL